MAMQNSLSFLFFSSLFIFSHFGERTKAASSNETKVYIVYMGDAASPANKHNHNLLVSSLLKRDENTILHNYKYGFCGFVARLTDAEAGQLAKRPGTVSVFSDPILQLHTTRSWDFMQEQTSWLINSPPRSTTASLSQGSDIIIGILDSGIWPESESFSDKDMSQIPKRWKGTCMEGPDFSSSNCNKKVIGARYYKDPNSGSTTNTARDTYGHGTHVASTAAGTSVLNTSYYGLASGIAKGGSPAARIAMYKVCDNRCRGSAVLAAFDDAIADGVDLLSLSLGSSAELQRDFSEDPIAIGAFHAVQRGITVVCSAGNEGPYRQSVVNVAPWIFTVAATTIDRGLESSVVLETKKIIKGGSINFSDLDESPVYPLIYGGSAKNSSRRCDNGESRICYLDCLDAEKIRGTIVLCQHNSTDPYSMSDKVDGLKANGALGVIFINDIMRLDATKWGSFPVTVITSKDGAEILDYVNSTRNPVATILPTETVPNYKPAPTVPYFSSRGPPFTTKNILKPDIAAPGVNILAAWIANDTSAETTPSGRKPPLFNFLSGTSMACPHVSGIVANIKSQNPDWSSAAIRSAIMTTAFQTNNLKEPITTQSGEMATPYDYGAGEVSPTGGLQPGLVYDTDPTDYLNFLCYNGYNLSTIKLISAELPKGFSCPQNSSYDSISNINYPSIMVSKNVETSPITVKRTVTNVANGEDTTYTATLDVPEGLKVDVMPKELRFEGHIKSLSYKVTFSSSSTLFVKDAMFGAITWTNGKYRVRSPFVVNRSI